MKNVILVATLLIASFGFAQSDSGFGIKGGLNYGSTGDFENEIENNVENPDSKLGYHLGVFAKADLGPIYIRPEVIYTKLSSEYTLGDLEVQKLDAPILLGVNVLGPLHVFAGPSLQYILDTSFETDNVEFDLGDAEDDFTVGLQLGVGLNLGSLGIDVRYERGFNENEAEFINNNTSVRSGRLDTRPEQLIVALSLAL
ncbi:Outer membrane protein beta-barrel domain-containing protein [Nonlabens sp. Hel1_33_55]|uniref:porin family protein n=1 Tax=Nonlabens sp. Hel1_33_55 TaxID=1336802 RepID=UPI000875E26A|nr:porin family protein [Nonlabens sp. Hel1_33_55]SCX97183.1 Outer membrane protein beta-barrel domain-containing protein [Nonlabens sp. Hel1_33_55]